MSWHPNDLVTDADLLAYESQLLTQFGAFDFADKRLKAINDWLWPTLDGKGFDPDRFRTRFVADAVYGYTSSTYSDLTSAASNETADDINLATVLAASSDYLYVGHTNSFRGLSFRIEDNPSTVAATLTLQVWADGWIAPVSVVDATQKTVGKPFSGGGGMTWKNPEGVRPRSVDGSDPLLWARVALSATPTGAKATQISVIHRSRLSAPVTFRTLALIFAEAPTRIAGPWELKRDYYEREAEKALERALPRLGGEFDTTQDDLIDSSEAQQTAEDVAGRELWSLERA